MTGEIEVSRDRFRCVFVVFCGLSREGVLRIGRLKSSRSFADMYNFLQRLQVMQKAALAEVQVK